MTLRYKSRRKKYFGSIPLLRVQIFVYLRISFYTLYISYLITNRNVFVFL